MLYIITMSSIVYLRNRKSNTIYAYLNESVWDESKGRNVYKRRCIGHVDPETGEIVPNRGGRTREYPVVKSRHLCDVFDSVAEGMKLTEALKLSWASSTTWQPRGARWCSASSGPSSTGRPTGR